MHEIILFPMHPWVGQFTSVGLSILVCILKNNNNGHLIGFMMRTYWDNSCQMHSLEPSTQ